LIQGDRRISYGELADQVCRFSCMLRARGLGSGARVAILLPNCIEAVVACYGTWLANCIAVPLSAQARSSELEVLLLHADPSLLICEEDNYGIQIAAGNGSRTMDRIFIGDGWEQALDCMLVMPTETELSSKATIMYTSGTTGSPKGVALTHTNHAANTDAIVEYLDLSARDSTVAVLPFHYAYGASVLHAHLAVGARLVLESNFLFPARVVDAIQRERITGFSGVSPMYTQLLDRVPLHQYDLSSLRYITHAGGPLQASLASRLGEALPGVQLVQMYGLTEATARLAWVPSSRSKDKPGSAGMAIAGVQIQILDEEGGVLPAGIDGEVWVHGANVMAGYWNDPETTASVLCDGWLRTGDAGRLDDEEFLFLAGRRSDIIKSGAHRVYPPEVEEVLCALPGVLDAAVVGVDDTDLGQVIKAFVVIDGRSLDAGGVRAHCRAHLAAHKVPRIVEFTTALPRTISGKLCRAALGHPSHTEVSHDPAGLRCSGDRCGD
jgi:acyl-CoA synthetase (AMP-forming)/AMP-acid ligase II